MSPHPKLSAGRRWWLARLALTAGLVVLNNAAYPASLAVQLWRAVLIGLGTAVFIDLMRWSWKRAGRDDAG